MQIKKEKIESLGLRFSARDEADGEAGRAFLYILKNDLHNRPFGFIEDVFVDEKYRGQGIGTDLVKAMIEEAKANDCYKLILTSRYEKPKVHALYEKIGFKDHGKEFRLDF